MELIVFLLVVAFVFFNPGSKNKKKPPVQAPGKGVKLSGKIEDLMSQLDRKLEEKMVTLDAEEGITEEGVSEEGVSEEIPLPEPVRPARNSADDRRARRAAVLQKRELRQAAMARAVEDEDEEGCVGGSMEHHQHEGESRAEHTRHIAEVQRREREETLSAQTAEALGQMNLRRLRQAVIMAEILDKPKSLRRAAPAGNRYRA